MTVDVKLLKYNFKFRRLSWREESALITARNKVRTLLAHALVSVSGIEVKSPQEAEKVFAAITTPVVNRVYQVYKGSLSKSRKFETANLYRAPEPSIYVNRVTAEEDVVDQATDRVMAKMEQDFGRQELEEAAALDRQIVSRSGMRGAVRIKPEDSSAT